MEIWETIAKNDAIVNMLEKSESDNEKAKELLSNAKRLEYEALKTVLESKGIKLGVTVVKNKRTGAFGVVYSDTRGYSGKLMWHSLEFYPLTKSGKVSKKPSLENKPDYELKLKYSFDAKHCVDCYVDKNGVKVSAAEARMLFIEGLADTLEATDIALFFDEIEECWSKDSYVDKNGVKLSAAEAKMLFIEGLDEE